MTALITKPLINRACYLLNADKTFKALGVEVLSINTPKIMITRTPQERLDVSVSEIGNTVGFFSILWGGGRLIDGLFKAFKLPINPNPNLINKGRVIKSALLIPTMCAFMYAMPFYRNAFTAWSSNTTDFRNLITDKNLSNTGEDGLVITGQRSAKSLAMVKEQVNKGNRVMLTGLGLSLLGGALGNFLFKGNSSQFKPMLKQMGMHHSLKKTLNLLCLPGPKATELNDFGAIMYWGAPCYLGWIAASRDQFEAKEMILKFINFNVMYLLPDWALNRLPYFKNGSKQLAKQLPQFYQNGKFSYPHWKAAKRYQKTPLLKKALAFENTKTMTKFATTTAFMAVFPALLNIWLTHQRIKRYDAQHTPASGTSLSKTRTLPAHEDTITSPRLAPTGIGILHQRQPNRRIPSTLA